MSSNQPDPHHDDKLSQRQELGSLLLWVALMIMVINLFTLPYSSTPLIPYSQFVDQVEAGQVNQAVISPHRIRYSIKQEVNDPSQFISSPDHLPQQD